MTSAMETTAQVHTYLTEILSQLSKDCDAWFHDKWRLVLFFINILREPTRKKLVEQAAQQTKEMQIQLDCLQKARQAFVKTSKEAQAEKANLDKKLQETNIKQAVITALEQKYAQTKV